MRMVVAAEQMGKAQVSGTLALWYRQPAARWVEALPLGNGSLGAMVFGGVPHERIGLNLDSLWSGRPRDPGGELALEHLATVRRLVLTERDYAGADLAARGIQGPYTESFLPLGDLWLELPGEAEPEEYTRWLDLSSAAGCSGSGRPSSPRRPACWRCVAAATAPLP
jgi:alpha-L-fucosidase 2